MMMSKSIKAAKQAEANPYVGSRVDEFFAADGLLEEIEAAAIKRVIAQALIAEMEVKNIAKTELARRLETSRSQVDRILDPENQSTTLTSLMKAAVLLGRRLHLSLETASA
jgi:antitoxin HicB